MKKIAGLLILVIILFPTIVFAGNTDEGIQLGNQDAFIIGKVTSYKDGLYSVHVEKVLMGEVEGTEINVKQHDNIAYCGLAVGNYAVISMDKKGTIYKVKLGAYRVDCPNYKTLKLDYASYNNVNERIQKFINSGRFIEANRKVKH